MAPAKETDTGADSSRGNSETGLMTEKPQLKPRISQARSSSSSPQFEVPRISRLSQEDPRSRLNAIQNLCRKIFLANFYLSMSVLPGNAWVSRGKIWTSALQILHRVFSNLCRILILSLYGLSENTAKVIDPNNRLAIKWDKRQQQFSQFNAV